MLSRAASGSALVLILAAACGTPDVVENRSPLRSCGRYRMEKEMSPARVAAIRQAVACILDALDDGRRAELIATELDEEGASYTTYVRVLGRRRVETFVSDSLGWHHYACTGITPQRTVEVEATGCRNLPLSPALPVRESE